MSFTVTVGTLEDSMTNLASYDTEHEAVAAFAQELKPRYRHLGYIPDIGAVAWAQLHPTGDYRPSAVIGEWEPTLGWVWDD